MYGISPIIVYYELKLATSCNKKCSRSQQLGLVKLYPWDFLKWKLTLFSVIFHNRVLYALYNHAVEKE